jgi:hypothetical protein
MHKLNVAIISNIGYEHSVEYLAKRAFYMYKNFDTCITLITYRIKKVNVFLYKP